MQKWIILFLCIASALFLFIMAYTKSSITTVKYFPIDDVAMFTEATTNVSILEDSPLTLNWLETSTSSEPMYLRQDISLLFENGSFKGIQSKWQQDETTIRQSQSFMPKRESYLEALTFHHGELHHENNKITSIQQLTTDTGYILSDGRGFTYLQQSEEPNENKKITQLRTATENNLTRIGKGLMEHFAISPEEYDVYSLIGLAAFENKPLPHFSEVETKQIIGQLWEGLYKNYVLRLKEKENQPFQHHMPLVLIAKDGSHLFVLYELHDGKQQLIQHLPKD